MQCYVKLKIHCLLSSHALRFQDQSLIYISELHDLKTGCFTEEARIERETIFIAALFTIARMWKQPRCPSADDWIR